jgi:hypothetical protein
MQAFSRKTAVFKQVIKISSLVRSDTKHQTHQTHRGIDANNLRPGPGILLPLGFWKKEIKKGAEEGVDGGN